MTSCAWLWVYVGAALMLLELFAPGFVIFFFGLSAGTVGFLRFLFGEAFTLTWQLAAFSVLSIVYLVGLRRLLKQVFMGNKLATKTDFDNESIGRIGKVTEAIRPPLAGRILLGDAEWAAVADAPLEPGAAVRIVAQDNLTMKVTAVN